MGSLSEFQSHSRYLLTLRSDATSAYKSLILFRLAAAVDGDQDQIYVMESACPHLGFDMSHADIEDMGDDGSLIAVCPWHRSVCAL